MNIFYTHIDIFELSRCWTAFFEFIFFKILHFIITFYKGRLLRMWNGKGNIAQSAKVQPSGIGDTVWYYRTFFHSREIKF